MYGHILVALKSDPSDETLIAHAAGLARLTHARLTLFHAVHSHTRDEGAFLEDDAAAYLAEHARKLADQGLVADTMIIRSEPAAGIRKAARDRAADLIVMGSHGHHSVRHVLLGSVTETVLRTCAVPALLVRP
jgi:Universal stress protein UspA and related nucleotide-binding proteins